VNGKRTAGTAGEQKTTQAPAEVRQAGRRRNGRNGTAMLQKSKITAKRQKEVQQPAVALQRQKPRQVQARQEAGSKRRQSNLHPAGAIRWQQAGRTQAGAEVNARI